jgi:hypothetical protein
MRKVIVRIKGGLGNQLYGYAAARRLSLVNDTELVIDSVSGFERDYQYKRKYTLARFAIPCRIANKDECFFPFERTRRAIAKLLAKRKPFEHRSYIEQEFSDLDNRLINLKIINPETTIDGLWQSEAYFKDIADTIRSDLRIQPSVNKMNIDAKNWILAHNTVAIHMRWFGNQNSSANVPLAYYHNAIKLVNERVNNPRFVIFSDNPKAAVKSLNLDREKFLTVEWNVQDGGEVDDLWLMTLCHHCVIANSTFSWWGAWLGDGGDDRLVIFPRCSPRDAFNWPWDYEGQMPSKWIPITI